MKRTEKTQTRPFKIFLPATETDEARYVETIEVEVFVDRDGEETLTPESAERIERIRARHRGLLSGEDIKALRKRLGLTQDELARMIQCGKKSLSRWENGHGYPSGLVNTLLRALDEGFLAPAGLRALQGPRSGSYQLPKSILVKSTEPAGQKIIHYPFSERTDPDDSPSDDPIVERSA